MKIFTDLVFMAEQDNNNLPLFLWLNEQTELKGQHNLIQFYFVYIWRTLPPFSFTQCSGDLIWLWEQLFCFSYGKKLNISEFVLVIFDISTDFEFSYQKLHSAALTIQKQVLWHHVTFPPFWGHPKALYNLFLRTLRHCRRHFNLQCWGCYDKKQCIDNSCHTSWGELFPVLFCRLLLIYHV